MPAGPAAPPHLVLVGLPGAGKSTVGRLVAERLGCRFVDLDLEIEERSGLSVSEIFEREGEEGFRRWETGLTAELADAPAAVIAPGGGWVTQAVNRARLGDRARVVFLRVGIPTAIARMGGAVAARPLLSVGDAAVVLSHLSREREPFYKSADAVIDTETVDTQQVAQIVIALATGWGWPVG